MMQSVEIVEVGPRDGLQNEQAIITTDDKVALINKAIAAGSRRIEVASFVHPGRVPQMADAEDVFARLPDNDDVTYIGLCLNKRGAMRALATRDNNGHGIDERYATHIARGQHQSELDARISAWTQGKTIEQLEILMVEYSIPAGRIYRAPDMLADPHFAAREAIIAREHAVHGSIKMQNAFPKLSANPSSVRSNAPATPGMHNAEIYGDMLGLTQQQMADLSKAGII